MTGPKAVTEEEEEQLGSGRAREHPRSRRGPELQTRAPTAPGPSVDPGAARLLVLRAPSRSPR